MEEEKKENPFWLPKGSMRALLALLGLSIAGYCIIKSISVPDC